MSWKVVQENGKTVAFGPNTGGYQPNVKAGQTLVITTQEPKAAVTNAEVNHERTRRIARPVSISLTTGKKFSVDMSGESRHNIADMAHMAREKIIAADVSKMTFRDASNVNQSLTAVEIVEMAVQVFGIVDAIYKASWALKDTDPIPDDYSNDKHWP